MVVPRYPIGLALVLCAAASTLRADPNRFAVIVGANHGEPDEAVLRYAQSDAERLASVLRQLGGFAPENVVLLAGAGADDVKRALQSVGERAQR